jgi:hypothetical protein
MTPRRRPPDGGSDHLLTPRRQQILDYIRESMERRGFSPSMRETADAVGLKSASTVSHHFKILKEAGYLDRDSRLPRTVVPRPSRLPVLRVEFNASGQAAVSLNGIEEKTAAGAGPCPSNVLRIETDMVHGKLFVVSSPDIVIDTGGLALAYSKLRIHSKNAAADPLSASSLSGSFCTPRSSSSGRDVSPRCLLP